MYYFIFKYCQTSITPDLNQAVTSSKAQFELFSASLFTTKTLHHNHTHTPFTTTTTRTHLLPPQPHSHTPSTTTTANFYTHHNQHGHSYTFTTLTVDLQLFSFYHSSSKLSPPPKSVHRQSQKHHNIYHQPQYIYFH